MGKSALEFGTETAGSPLPTPVRGRSCRRLGRLLERRFKNFLAAALARIVPTCDSLPVTDLCDIRKIIIIRPNFRIGNTVMSASLTRSIRERFSEAQVDFLAADSTACLLENLAMGRIFTVSKKDLRHPLRLLHLLRRLRRERYDAAIDAGLGSFSSALLTFVSGARYRIGESRKWGRSLMNVRIERGADSGHAYDSRAAFAKALGAPPHYGPLYVVTDDEKKEALGRLRDMKLFGEGRPLPFLALFVGGHLNKRWPKEKWITLVRRLEGTGAPVVLFTGPEERDLIETIGTLKSANLRIVPQLPLRRLAALCAQATLVVSPDTGPMHLAAALGVPVIAVLQIERSLAYAPAGALDRRLMRPDAQEAAKAITDHPLWPLVAGRPEPMEEGVSCAARIC